MEVLTKKQWAVCAVFLSSATGKPMTEAQVEVYYDLLSDIPFDVLKTACRRAVQSQDATWLPAVGLIRKFAADAVYGTLPEPEVAWKAVLAAYDGTWSSDETEKAFASLPPFIQKVLKSAPYSGGFGEERFVGLYKRLAKQEVELRQLSIELRPTITGNTLNAPLIEGPSERPATLKLKDES